MLWLGEGETKQCGECSAPKKKLDILGNSLPLIVMLSGYLETDFTS